MTVLSVNVNKVALLRNSRGGHRPDVLSAARTAIRHGAAGITVHPRPDQRHIRPRDVLELAAMLRADFLGTELNIEGNPFAPAAGGYPGFVALVEQARPQQCTLVPDSDAQLTSDHGFTVSAEQRRLAEMIERLHDLGARVSLFMDADATDELRLVREVGADRIEIYTGPYAAACLAAGATRADPGATRLAASALDTCRTAARFATQLGLGVNAGHDLDLDNLAAFATIGEVAEVSIGHALIADALDFGLGEAVARYVAILRRAA